MSVYYDATRIAWEYSMDRSLKFTRFFGIKSAVVNIWNKRESQVRKRIPANGRETLRSSKGLLHLNFRIADWRMVNVYDFPWTLTTWSSDFFSLSWAGWVATKIYLVNVRAARKRERERRKGEECPFKSGRKNPLGKSDLLRVHLDVSNERPVTDGGMGKTIV